jgi:hypothetical protein
MFNLTKQYLRIILLICCAVSTPVSAATVVEFYNSNLDTYFITAGPTEQAAIDGGSAGPGWSRTGYTFPAGGSTPVCRFYGSVWPGPNSHFYTVDPTECAFLKSLQIITPITQPRWNFENLDFLSTPVQANGTCLAGTVPVYRAYNNGSTRGVDSNHRITTSMAAIQEVVNRGWTYEGAVMCAPNPTVANGTITWVVGNQWCGGEVDYKFFDIDNSLVWPSASSYYYSYYGQTYTSRLSCISGAKICLGANSGTWYWGVGVNNNQSCTDCCGYCDGRTYTFSFGGC